MQQKIIVCGGRNYDDRDQLFRILDAAHLMNPIILLIHGDASGADTLAKEWALKNDVFCQAYPADWEGLGRRAGPIRNQQMLSEGKPHLVVAFPGGKGTADMIKRAEIAGVPVARVKRRTAAMDAIEAR
jgi:YspA, cpYpsA-related SLOG family